MNLKWVHHFSSPFVGQEVELGFQTKDRIVGCKFRNWCFCSKLRTWSFSHIVILNHQMLIKCCIFCCCKVAKKVLLLPKLIFKYRYIILFITRWWQKKFRFFLRMTLLYCTLSNVHYMLLHLVIPESSCGNLNMSFLCV